MSRKNRSKFIAFRLKNNQICKAVFVQYDDAQARQIATHQPPASHHRHGLDSPAPTPPKASTQPQRIAGQHQRTAEERQHPGERAEGRERGREREERPENDSKRAPPSLHPRQSHRPGAPPMPPAVPAYKARGQPRRAPEDRGSNSAFVEYAELPLTNAAHAIPGEARQGGYFTF